MTASVKGNSQLLRDTLPKLEAMRNNFHKTALRKCNQVKLRYPFLFMDKTQGTWILSPPGGLSSDVTHFMNLKIEKFSIVIFTGKHMDLKQKSL